MSGCTNTGSTSATPVATPTPQIVYMTVTPTPVPVQKAVLFSDDLHQWRSEWESEYDYTDGKVFYSGGSLHIRDVNPTTGTMYHKLNKNFNDFILDVDTKTVDGSIDNWQGLNVREQDPYNYYGLSVSADGYYSIVKFMNGNRQGLTGSYGIYSGYINTGIGASNHIHCEVNKNSLSLSVNGHHLSTVTDNAFREGTVSLKAYSNPSNSFTEVVYNNLVITSL